MRSVRAGDLEIAYHETGAPHGAPVLLLHGFPYDVHAYDAVVAHLEQSDSRVLVPYLRGYGPTRFLSEQTLRSGQQAALASDLLAFMDALEIERAVLGGYDWGGRAACIVAALHPERVRGLVTGGGYNLQNIPQASEPLGPDAEQRLWYQYYFHSERGRRALIERRADVCRYLWSTWSPLWTFDDATFARTAQSFANPDFVDVVVHSYRHRFGLVAGDPAFAAIERALEEQPDITVPTISFEGAADGLTSPSEAPHDSGRFVGPFEERVLPRVGHNIPQEAPEPFARAILEVMR